MADFYKILGVDRDASQSDIKKAYRELSKKYHPDKNPGDKAAEAKFKEINEAYDTIGDEKKRAEYDDPMRGFNGFGFNPFSDFGFGHAGAFRRNTEEMRGADVTAIVHITIKDLYTLDNKVIKYTRKKKCHKCGGNSEVCPVCNGTGVVQKRDMRGNMISITTAVCEKCHGTGRVARGNCAHCNNTGFENEACEYTIDLKKLHASRYLYMDGVRIQTSAVGDDGIGNKPGSLIIQITHDKDAAWSIENNTLVYNMRVGVLDMLTGCKKEITLPDGKKIRINIKECASPNRLYSVNNCGIYNADCNTRGTLLVRVDPVWPVKISSELKSAIEKNK